MINCANRKINYQMLICFYFTSICASSPMNLLTSTSRQENFDSHLLIVHNDLKRNKKNKNTGIHKLLFQSALYKVYENLYFLSSKLAFLVMRQSLPHVIAC